MISDQSQKPTLILSGNNWVKAIALFLVGLIIGVFAAGFYFKGKLEESKKDAAGLSANIALPQNPVSTASSNEIMDISGVVLKIDGKNITIGSFSFGKQKTYIAKVSDSTKIIKREIAIDILKSVDDNALKYPFKETDAKFEDIRLNDVVFVEAKENIESKTDFEAKSLGIQILNKNISAGSSEIKGSSVPSNQSISVPPASTVPAVPSISVPSTSTTHKNSVSLPTP